MALLELDKTPIEYIELFTEEELLEKYNKVEEQNNIEQKQHSNNKTIVRISDLVNDNFKEVWYSTHDNIILKGGRSSLKSSVASLKLCKDFLEDDNANIVCFRKVAAYLSISVYGQMFWALTKLNATEQFRFFKSPLKIEHIQTGTAFYFYGVDDPQKIKSAKITKGYVKAIWFEEGAEFSSSEELDIVADTFIRENAKDNNGEEIQVQTIVTYNPPRNPYAWINEWVKEKEKDPHTLIHHSTYKEDKKGFLSKQFLRKVKQIEENDPDYHAWMYGGEVKGFGDNVYNINLFNVIDNLPTDDKLILADIALDTGYSVSSTTFLYIGLTLKGNVIVLDTYYYNPEKQATKKAPSDFSKELYEFTNDNTTLYKLPIDTEVIDSADGALRNQYYKDYAKMLIPAKKKKKVLMIENVEDLLAQGRVYVLNTKRNKIFIEEHKKYQWDPKTKDTDDPKVIKEDDHTCDAFQYYVNNNLAKLGLKF